MNFLSLMSGPLMALVRYAVTAGSAYALGKGLPPDVVTHAGALVLAGAPAVIGMLTSTKAAAVAKVADVPGAKVTLPSGRTVTSAAEANRAMSDPTWDDPNAR
jgi:hypothetical protein